ncbi:tripartite tricarboxylate transporter substrate-binding protein [Chenggangzhangella methanolivorans]|uniref:Tripartite tricarboxylate transporter substrate binding protein BugD n=1 Tax=Chenggangzhangella methanolivorans TaxID=1437009 RepID=A0A9E6RBR4_9HYPH|nr:tripartite tricarboxylate transporter substrate-binding protein [Chenggangzhangella methanolivorans]QZO00945.1 tripartite tricarboxylate transporter substrate binding protein BugD [Chenggangzhangella methanolivorans]
MTSKTRFLALFRSVAAAAGVAVALTAAASPARAAYPDRVVTLIVPFAAGGPSDIIARLVGDSMSKTIGQQIVIENVTGAGGTLAAARVARAEPDGYTLLIHHVALAASASLYDNLGYDAGTAFQPLGLVNGGPMILTSKTAFPAADAKAMFAKLKSDGPSVSVAHAGIGSNSHLCALLLQRALGSKFNLISYRGNAPALNDMMGGQVDVLCDQSTTGVPPFLAGKVKAYAVSSKQRLDVVKDLPTFEEAGLKGFEFQIWHALYAPKGAPAEVVTKLHDALQVALKDPKIVARFKEVGTSVFPEAELSVEAHKAKFEREIATWKKVFAESGEQKVQN